MEFASPLPHDEERIDTYYDGEPLRYRTMENLLGDQPVPGLVPPPLAADLPRRAPPGDRASIAARSHAASSP